MFFDKFIKIIKLCEIKLDKDIVVNKLITHIVNCNYNEFDQRFEGNILFHENSNDTYKTYGIYTLEKIDSFETPTYQRTESSLSDIAPEKKSSSKQSAKDKDKEKKRRDRDRDRDRDRVS
mgnify:CR=1 FL=1